jgi:hypothetical protein
MMHCDVQLINVRSQVAEQAFSRVHSLDSMISYMSLPHFMLILKFYMADYNRSKEVSIRGKGAQLAKSIDFAISRFEGMVDARELSS